ncbi:hypothetical protein [Sphingomonas sp. LaA6.9]|uniref:hypothetical protein n=1 Tax=Sphingomonas sp. LaA6.9 TaxID=2919914 RepID=UPI001F4F5670|nr:hypothetical protein [Sphingomonas sp. LaA6.9]MCJ8157400.1 hypothetical protein [Sphingomonas sp. LaA6.9]
MPSFTSTNNNPADSAILASSAGEGLHAESTSTAVAAVAAFQLDQAPASTGPAVFGEARGGGTALVGLQVNAQSGGSGVYGECKGSGSGVHGEAKGNGNGVFAKVNNPNGSGAALYAEHSGDKTAGFFKGNVVVTGDVSFPGMDCAEEFVVSSDPAIGPGTLMSIGDDGVLEPSASAYDNRVVGVVAGAGDFRPGIVMGKGQHGERPARPIALVGRAYCKADARYGAIRVGDLLTSSPHPGHAMKASDQGRAFGAVIGKAMAPLDEGAGLVPILIALQ